MKLQKYFFYTREIKKGWQAAWAPLLSLIVHKLFCGVWMYMCVQSIIYLIITFIEHSWVFHKRYKDVSQTKSVGPFPLSFSLGFWIFQLNTHNCSPYLLHHYILQFFLNMFWYCSKCEFMLVNQHTKERYLYLYENYSPWLI